MAMNDEEFLLIEHARVTDRFDELAAKYGLADGLRLEINTREWRCRWCLEMMPTFTPLVWVPDGVKRDDPAWKVTEQCRRQQFNGEWSSWCVQCAPKKPQAEPSYLFANTLNPGPNISRRPPWMTRDKWIAFAISMGALVTIGMLLCWWGSRP